QSQQQDKEQKFLKASSNKTSSALISTNNENKDDEQCKADHKDDIPRLSVIVFQCHLCSFSTRSNEKWLEHKQCHIEDIPSTSTLVRKLSTTRYCSDVGSMKAHFHNQDRPVNWLYCGSSGLSPYPSQRYPAEKIRKKRKRRSTSSQRRRIEEKEIGDGRG
ncbi:uncharacterized protein LOC111614535, partial [Centruroides sculpturatus]|uniref:uncharacterized protein LOC111614535 n=1 Tax=Centruroides sculpturatus TaxID=218467 RepID=UPI000C6CEDE7